MAPSRELSNSRTLQTLEPSNPQSLKVSKPRSLEFEMHAQDNDTTNCEMNHHCYINRPVYSISLRESASEPTRPSENAATKAGHKIPKPQNIDRLEPTGGKTQRRAGHLYANLANNKHSNKFAVAQMSSACPLQCGRAGWLLAKPTGEFGRLSLARQSKRFSETCIRFRAALVGVGRSSEPLIGSAGPLAIGDDTR